MALRVFLITILMGITSTFGFGDCRTSEEINPKKKSDIIQLKDPATKEERSYIFDRQIYLLRCDTLPQIRFWRKIMNLSKDSGLVNVADTRFVLSKCCTKEWNNNSEECKSELKLSLKQFNCVEDSEKVFFTEGKSFFYDFNKVYPNLHQGITVFQKNNVDPWYAQAILLIESPGRLQKSTAGAYGPFQLMPYVARKYGLIVNRKKDERANLEKSAYCASMLLKNVCIPKTKQALDSLGISYSEQDLWFRCLVMHTYHAGIGNVMPALEACGVREPGMDLIQKLWQTQAKGFKNASQAYSQLALAAMLEMDLRANVNYEQLESRK